LPEVKASSITIPANAFRSMIESTIYAITQEESRYALSGAKVEINKDGMRMVTTDGHRLALIDSKEVTAAETLELLIPKKHWPSCRRSPMATKDPSASQPTKTTSTFKSAPGL